MKQSMELFGEALHGYLQGDKSAFFFEDVNGNKYKMSLARYFRTYSQFTTLEQKIISLAHGEILDVGCGTGMFIPYLSKQGNVIGIDISSPVVEVARERGIAHVAVRDIFDFKSRQKYDTIVLFENNFGLAGTVSRARQLLEILGSLLTPTGCILTNATTVTRSDYFENELYSVWKKKRGESFKWISFNVRFLAELCAEAGLRLDVVDSNSWHYLAKISKG